MTSGPFHLIHSGHIRLLNEAGDRGALLVLVNGDGFMLRKHGFCAVPLAERMAVVDGVRGVAAVVPWDDGTQTVAGALKLIRPAYFCKGGDRTPDNMSAEEVQVCREVGCEIVYGVGGYDKAESSSRIAKMVFHAVLHAVAPAEKPAGGQV